MPSNSLDDLDLAGEHGEERALSALVDGEFSGAEVQVGGGAGQPLDFGRRQVGEQRNRRYVGSRQHKGTRLKPAKLKLTLSGGATNVPAISQH